MPDKRKAVLKREARTTMNILIVEDQRRLAQALAAILIEAGYHVDTVYDGRDGLDYARAGSYDAVVLDVMLPKLDGFEVIRELRRNGGANRDVPIIMLTARDTLRDKIAGLDAGADDYLTKPFQPAELLARLRALTRRQGTVIMDTITMGNTTLDLQLSTLSVDDSRQGAVHLSQRELDVCRMLMSNAKQTISKSRLLTSVWGMASDSDENSVEAYISFLRKKLRFLHSNLQIKTLRMLGYRLDEIGDARYVKADECFGDEDDDVAGDDGANNTAIAVNSESEVSSC